MNECPSYDLLKRPWIPVVWKVDAVNPEGPRVGIRNALKRAHEIQCISHTAPFIEFGLSRLLITIVLDAYIVAGLRPTIGKMKQMLQTGKLDWEIMQPYLNQHKCHFNLWGDSHRFLQCKSSDENEKGVPIVRMFSALPSGTNVIHWNHFLENETAVTEEIAAWFLTAVSPWNFKTKPGEARTLAGDPPMYALALGSSLFENIVLNLPRPNGRITTNLEKKNGPIWRTPINDLAKLPKTPTAAQGFTWPVRFIWLENDGSLISKAVNHAAYKKPTEKAKENGGKLYDPKSAWRDPNAGTVSSRDAIEHIKARPGVPIWRDAVPLFLVASEGETLRGEKRRSRPEVITNALRVLNASRIHVAVYGMCKKSGGGGDVKVEEWFRSILEFPAEVARDNRLSARALNSFTTTQKVADTLRIALRMLRAPSAAKKNDWKNILRGEIDAINDFWRNLERPLARTYLDALGKNDPAAEKKLRLHVRKETQESFSRAADPHRRTIDGLFRIANASNYLARKLNRLLPEEMNP